MKAKIRRNWRIFLVLAAVAIVMSVLDEVLEAWYTYLHYVTHALFFLVFLFIAHLAVRWADRRGFLDPPAPKA